jgi:hypothetical protein
MLRDTGVRRVDRCEHLSVSPGLWTIETDGLLKLMTEEMLILFPIPCAAGFHKFHRKSPTQPRDEIVYHAH